MKTYLEIKADEARDKELLENFIALYGMNASANEFRAALESIDLTRIVNESQETDEGLLGGIAGFVGGLAFGTKIGDAICKALGITKGLLYDLFHSKLFTTAVCTYLGIKA